MLIPVMSVGELDVVEEIVVAEAPEVVMLTNGVEVVSRFAVLVMPCTLVVSASCVATAPDASYTPVCKWFPAAADVAVVPRVLSEPVAAMASIASASEPPALCVLACAVGVRELVRRESDV